MCDSGGGMNSMGEWSMLANVPAESAEAASSKPSTRRGGRAARPSSSSAVSVGPEPTSSSRTPRVSRSTSSRRAGRRPRTVYAPSQTSVFIRCPRLWDLSRRWVPLDGWSPNLSVGSAVHQGIAHFYLGPKTSKSEAVAAGLAWLDREVTEEHLADGQWSRDGLHELVARGIELGLETDLLEGGDLVAVEKCLTHTDCPTPVPGRCEIADLIHRSAQGLVVTDHKTSIHKEPKWVGKALDETATEWQFWHYAWAAGQFYREPVVMVRKHLIILGPKPKAYLHPVATPPGQVAMWLESAKVWWRIMEEIDGKAYPAPQNFTACRDFGGCKFYDGCHSLAGDESSYLGLYAVRERVADRSEGAS